MSLDPTIGERAAAALDAYWMRTGYPANHDTVVRAHAAIKDRLADGYGTRWQALLNKAMADIGCSVDWDGEAVRNITVWGEPPACNRA